MTLTVNGQPRPTDDARTVEELIRAMGLAGRPVAVEVNREVVPKRRHADTPLRDGDVVELVTLVGGG
jgi:sulfur carrier protein